MAILSLRIIEPHSDPYMEYFVNGVSLPELIRSTLRTSAAESMDDVLPLGCGDFDLEDSAIGETARTHGLEGAILFACGCGYAACSCTNIDVVLTENTISFCNLRIGNNVCDFPPIEFNREQFCAEVADLQLRLATWKPTLPPPPPPRRVIELPGRDD
jgi:hypothetical protein